MSVRRVHLDCLKTLFLGSFLGFVFLGQRRSGYPDECDGLYEINAKCPSCKQMQKYASCCILDLEWTSPLAFSLFLAGALRRNKKDMQWPEQFSTSVILSSLPPTARPAYHTQLKSMTLPCNLANMLSNAKLKGLICTTSNPPPLIRVVVSGKVPTLFEFLVPFNRGNSH